MSEAFLEISSRQKLGALTFGNSLSFPQWFLSWWIFCQLCLLSQKRQHDSFPGREPTVKNLPNSASNGWLSIQQISDFSGRRPIKKNSHPPQRWAVWCAADPTPSDPKSPNDSRKIAFSMTHFWAEWYNHIEEPTETPYRVVTDYQHNGLFIFSG